MASSIEEDPDREREAVDGLVARRIDGLILMPASRDQDYLDADRAAGLAVVAVDRRPLVHRHSTPSSPTTREALPRRSVT